MISSQEERNLKSLFLEGLLNEDQSSVKPIQTSLQVDESLFQIFSFCIVLLPEGYDREFLSLEPIVRAAYRRRMPKRWRSITFLLHSGWIVKRRSWRRICNARSPLRNSLSWSALANLDVSKAGYRRYCTQDLQPETMQKNQSANVGH